LVNNREEYKEMWDDIVSSLELKYSPLENDTKIAIQDENLKKFAQLGLKSHWLKKTTSSEDIKSHNRYSHSVGVMKIATYLYDRAMTNSGITVNAEERQFLRLAALLHDVGHLPFSHLIESVFQELNWKPAGYSDNYSHVLQTEEKINEIFSNPELPKLASALRNTGYCIEDLINLVHGRFGIPYLDAIINSPLDADKIDYVFRDTRLTDRRISLSSLQFLFDVYNDISISPEKFMIVSRASSKAFAELLNARRFLYHNLYLQPSILILEGIVKLILKTYFVHHLKLDDSGIIRKLDFTKEDIPDLGEYKIKYCVQQLLEIMNQQKIDNIELGIVKSMFQKIENLKNKLNSKFFDNLQKGWNIVNNIQSQEQLKALEQKMTVVNAQ
jgi:HD superfamily phosphohydrolase